MTRYLPEPRLREVDARIEVLAQARNGQEALELARAAAG